MSVIAERNNNFKNPRNPEPLLSVEQVSQLAGLNPEVVRRAIRSGELKASTLRRRLRIRISDYEAWIDSNRCYPEVYT
jgi:excisionase family DNA binding protein